MIFCNLSITIWDCLVNLWLKAEGFIGGSSSAVLALTKSIAFGVVGAGTLKVVFDFLSMPTIMILCLVCGIAYCSERYLWTTRLYPFFPLFSRFGRLDEN